MARHLIYEVCYLVSDVQPSVTVGVLCLNVECGVGWRCLGKIEQSSCQLQCVRRQIRCDRAGSYVLPSRYGTTRSGWTKACSHLRSDSKLQYTLPRGLTNLHCCWWRRCTAHRIRMFNLAARSDIRVYRRRNSSTDCPESTTSCNVPHSAPIPSSHSTTGTGATHPPVLNLSND